MLLQAPRGIWNMQRLMVIAKQPIKVSPELHGSVLEYYMAGVEHTVYSSSVPHIQYMLVCEQNMLLQAPRHLSSMQRLLRRATQPRKVSMVHIYSPVRTVF